MDTLRNILAYIKRLPRLYSIGGAALIVVAALLGLHFAFKAAPAPAAPPEITHVEVASVSSLSNQAGPLQVTGNVTSLSQATVLAESSGEIVSLSHALGDRVAAGDVIASFQNGSQQAAVLQAQGAYEAAQASLSKATGSTAQNSSITSTQADQTVENAARAADAALQSAYAALDDAVDTKADQLFSNPQSSSATLLPFTIPDSQLIVNIENERVALGRVLDNAQSFADASTSGSVDSDVTLMISDAQTVLAFLNDLVEGINEAVPNQSVSAAVIAADQASVAAARTEVISAISSLMSAKSAYDGDVASAQSAANSAGSGTESDVATAQADVKSALGALDAAQASLENTIIRSPISGTIVSLPITLGDYVSSFSQVAEVSNPGALEVDAYVTPDDAKTLAVGGVATISGSTKGVITFIAPALDPSTGKIEVKIGVVGSQSALTDGDTVNVSLDRSATTGASGADTGATSTITIPIAAAKITPTGPVVFTVSSSTLVSDPVIFGAILGDQVAIMSGLTPEMDIVTDARGLSDGQTVIVDTGN